MEQEDSKKIEEVVKIDSSVVEPSTVSTEEEEDADTSKMNEIQPAAGMEQKDDDKKISEAVEPATPEVTEQEEEDKKESEEAVEPSKSESAAPAAEEDADKMNEIPAQPSAAAAEAEAVVEPSPAASEAVGEPSEDKKTEEKNEEVSTHEIDSSAALKAAKKILKKQDDKTLKLKALAKLVAEELGIEDKLPSKDLKTWVKESPKFTIDENKMVTWVGKKGGKEEPGQEEVTEEPEFDLAAAIGAKAPADIAEKMAAKKAQAAKQEAEAPPQPEAPPLDPFVQDFMENDRRCPLGHYLHLETVSPEKHGGDCRCDICFSTLSVGEKFLCCTDCQGLAVCKDCKEKSAEPNPFLTSVQHCDNGWTLFDQKEYGMAVSEFQKSLEIRQSILRKQPDNPISEIHLHCSLDAEMLAKSKHQLGDIEGSRDHCTLALKHLEASGYLGSTCPNARILRYELDTLLKLCNEQLDTNKDNQQQGTTDTATAATDTTTTETTVAYEDTKEQSTTTTPDIDKPEDRKELDNDDKPLMNDQSLKNVPERQDSSNDGEDENGDQPVPSRRLSSSMSRRMSLQESYDIMRRSSSNPSFPQAQPGGGRRGSLVQQFTTRRQSTAWSGTKSTSAIGMDMSSNGNDPPLVAETAAVAATQEEEEEEEEAPVQP